MRSRTDIEYRRSEAEGATAIGLLLTMYDTLASDLNRAGEAADRHDIAVRCNASNHALLILGHLESWVEMLGDSALRSSLANFYTYLRIEILRLQASPSARDFHSIVSLVAETRAAWQKKEDLEREKLNQKGGTSPGSRDVESPQQSRLSLSA